LQRFLRNDYKTR